VLTKGSKYRVVSAETRDKPLVSHGTFRGYAAIGQDDGIVLELDESHRELAGRLRIIPVAMVISIDVIRAAEDADTTKEPETMYG
jgi:hypothetical protein